MKEIIYKAKKNIFLYNSLTKKKEKFIPIKNNEISMYICGPTLYKKIHLGNCRTFIFFDILYRYFKHLKFNIKYIRNITDINFNLIKQNNYFNYVYNIKKNFLNFHKILNKLNLLPPNLEPRTTNHIIDQIENIKKIINCKLTYKINGSIYFDIYKYNKKFGNYGRILNNFNINDILKKNHYKYKKKNNIDFSLWKNINNRIKNIKWNTIWSSGIPGWHIGCTTIINKYLGEFIDIHGGGCDLKFPHHESEISLANIINNNKKNLAKFWVHTNMLTINKKKMSKSLNNLILPYDIMKYDIIKNYPLIIRLYFLQTNYRNIIDFNFKSIKNTINNYFNLLLFFKKIKKIKTNKITSKYINIKLFYNICYESINDDFNIPLLIYNLIKINNIINKCLNNELQISYYDLKKIKKLMKIFLIDILGLKKINNKKKDRLKIKNLIKNILNIRNEIREKRLYYFSDKIRNILKDYITIKDNKINF